jgi:osmotically-inducible protein OsmY
MYHRRLFRSDLLLAVTALVAAYGFVACSTAPRRTETERAADAAIAAQVEAALLADPNIYARHIEVVVDRGVVALGGFVWSNKDYQLARNDAASIPGVKTVDVAMELMRGGVSGTSR